MPQLGLVHCLVDDFVKEGEHANEQHHGQWKHPQPLLESRGPVNLGGHLRVFNGKNRPAG